MDKAGGIGSTVCVSGPIHLKRRQGPASEAVVAILGVGAALFAARIPLPGVRYEALAEIGSVEPDALVRLGALGIMPLVLPFAVLEAAVAAWAFFGKRPEPGPAGRRTMTIVAFVLAFVLACVQAAGIVAHLHGLSHAPPFLDVFTGSPWIAGACLVAYPMAAGAIALCVSRLGMGDGFSLVVLASLISGAVREGRAVWAHLSVASLPAPDRVRAILVITAVLAAMVVLCILALGTRLQRDRDPPVVLLAAGALPAYLASHVTVLLAAAAAYLGAGVQALPATGSSDAALEALVHAAITVAAAVPLAWLLRLPARVSRTEPRLDVRAFRRRLLVLGVASAAALVLLVRLADLAEQVPFHLVGVDTVRVLLVVAICLDLLERVRFRVRLGFSPSAMEIAVYHTVFEAEVASRRLSEAGIPHHVQGLFHRRVLYFVAAYVAMPLLVAETDVVRARIALKPDDDPPRIDPS
jgi:preprotein translocase subunit SecY